MALRHPQRWLRRRTRRAELVTVRFLVLYTKPDDPQSWEQHYQGTHIPAARNIPGIERLWTGLASRAHDEEPAYYRVTEIGFADQAAFDAATDSAEWQESAADFHRIAPPGSQFLVLHLDG